jgi:hypothetical protein
MSVLTTALEKSVVEGEGKLKKARQSLEQYCAVEVARSHCNLDAKLDSIEEMATMLQDQLGRHQTRWQQLQQKHRDDIRLFHTSLLSLQSEVESIETRQIRNEKGHLNHHHHHANPPPATSNHHPRINTIASDGTSFDSSSSSSHNHNQSPMDLEPAVLTRLEKDYHICREGLSYLRHTMEQFEKNQVDMSQSWNDALNSLRQSITTVTKNMEQQVHYDSRHNA